MEELNELKLVLGDVAEGQDELLTVLLERAGEIIGGLTRIPTDYKYLKIEAAVYAFNQRGAEGSKSSNTGGFGVSWYHSMMSSYIKSNMPARYVIR